MQGQMLICGVDEAGRGPVLGPLVVAGVCVEDEEALRAMGVRDSKKLTPAKREALFPLINKVARTEVVEVPAEELDELMKRSSLNRIEARIFARIIDTLEPAVAYVDAADVDERKFGRIVSGHMTHKAKVVSEHRADDTYPTVSAASIVAKVVRDRRIREIEAEIGEPIGSGYASDPDTIRFVQKWVKAKGSCPPHTRQAWETSQNIMTMNSLKSLDEFEG